MTQCTPEETTKCSEAYYKNFYYKVMDKVLAKYEKILKLYGSTLVDLDSPTWTAEVNKLAGFAKKEIDKLNKKFATRDEFARELQGLEKRLRICEENRLPEEFWILFLKTA